MKATRFAVLAILAATILLTEGCNQNQSAHQRLDVAVKNQAAFELNKVNVRFGSNDCYVGVLIPNSLAVHMFFEATVGDLADVSWVAKNETRGQASASLAGIYDPKKAGRLLFEIDGEKVRVTFQELR